MQSLRATREQEAQLPLSETHERCYRFGVHLDVLDELLVRQSRVAEEDLHFLRISIVDCGEFLEYD